MAKNSKMKVNQQLLSQYFGDSYVPGELLNEGTYGRVYAATMKNGDKQIAIKLSISKEVSNDFCKNKLPNELNTLKELKHPYII